MLSFCYFQGALQPWFYFPFDSNLQLSFEYSIQKHSSYQGPFVCDFILLQCGVRILFVFHLYFRMTSLPLRSNMWLIYVKCSKFFGNERCALYDWGVDFHVETKTSSAIFLLDPVRPHLFFVNWSGLRLWDIQECMLELVLVLSIFSWISCRFSFIKVISECLGV